MCKIVRPCNFIIFLLQYFSDLYIFHRAPLSAIIIPDSNERNDFLDLEHRLAISYYKTIAVINEPHQIYLVQHQETHKIYIKKVLDVFNIDVYKSLYDNPITGTPKIIDYIVDDNKLIIIEEFISGCSLLDKIENGDLSFPDILNYMLDLCNILEKLHSQSPAIIHRDIKPSNVIITSYNRAVLLDFNAAKYYSKQANEDTVLLGTQGYAAPEQYGFGASSPQTDIYSLGIVFKEMLHAINYSDADTSSIISKCTRINPAERYKSIQELRKELSAFQKQEVKVETPKEPINYLPPGFRTKTPWKMAIALIGYLFIAWICFSLEMENTYGLALWIERFFSFLIVLFIVFSCFNYLDIQKYMPFYNHRNKLMQILGIVASIITVGFFLLLLMCIIVSIPF